MHIDNMNGSRRGLFLVAAAVSISLGVAACNDTVSIDPQRDRVPPTLSLTAIGGQPDTVIAFTTQAKDNLGLKTIHVQAIGAVGVVFDTVFTSAVVDITLPFKLFSSRAVPAGTPVTITATALDGAGNSSGIDTLIMATGNIPPPEVRVLSPTSGSSAVLGKSILVTVMGKSGVKIRSLGLNTTGPVVLADSVIYSSPLLDSTTMQDTIAIPLNATPGTLTITPFLRDSLGQRAVGPSITITVVTAAQVNSVPVVNAYCVGSSAFDNACGHGRRVEVGDTVHVEADDPSGILELGYEVRSTAGGAIDDSATFVSTTTPPGQLTFDSHTFSMRLPYVTFPTTVYIQVFARNTNGVKSYAKLAGGTDRVDTVVVVAGVTRPLPAGGQVADALYHTGKDRLYLTNITRNQVEVFSLADSSFKTPIFVGSRPWGLTVWPTARGTAAAPGMGDTLLVANSGGTDISYIDLNVGADGAEVHRYALPNIIVYSVTTVTGTTSGLPFQQLTRYDFSDRPQFPAATCIVAGGVCTDVLLAYTTTPTPGQTTPFQNLNGTIRWENLTHGESAAGRIDPHTSHFFFEPAMGQSAGRADTLKIVRFDANGIDSAIVVPYNQPVAGGFYSVTVRLPELGFRDTTFARNSGNFQRAIFGEGGSVFGSRAVAFDADRGFAPTFTNGAGVVTAIPIPVVDMGISPATAVSDFIGNTFAQVKGVSINFDGSLSAIRADSTYVLNPLLRLQGVLNTTVNNAGLDFHPLNTGPNSFPLTTRLLFAASSEPLIEIFDTRCYQRIASIPIRDPIIGPIKAAYRGATGQLVLVAATARGVVIAQLPNTFTTTCP
ncbi:MAG TPA: hypothetical protein VK544_06200 [Gemmatimonadaceae bacterium]|nr:hypothetical protein [Gemmatimonadaceae bacterium]